MTGGTLLSQIEDELLAGLSAPLPESFYAATDPVCRFSTGYFDQALFNLDSVISRAEHDLRGVPFDTLVGTGFSGGVVIPALARELGANYVLIRKDTDDSHHGSGRLIGGLGARWIFVDDFVSSGRTRNRVIEKIATEAQMRDFPTKYVGSYLYAIPGGEPRFEK